MDEWNTLVAELDSALGVFAGLKVSASVVMLVLVAVGVGRLVHRRRARAAAARPNRWRTFMTTRVQSSPAARALARRLSAARLAEVSPELSRLHVRRDRAAVALVGALALVVFLVTGMGALFGASSAAAAGWSLLIAAASLGGLRALALRDRAADRPAAPADDALTGAAPAEDADATAPHADPARDRRTLETVLAFGAPAAAPAAEETGTAGVVDGRGAETRPVPEALRSAAPAVPSGHGCVVIPAVPRPTYLDAPEMERPAPAPLEAAPVPATSGRIKDSLSPETARAEDISPTAERDIAALDLDNVLARRRAS
ncbi:hypothetical protein [uncultured Micrococcus sp.]|uniref:hypothetical protein n=1 Tax=uncultured Micrococcus sp. TaxID=114051 RepID=UPI00261568F2|nr:hypothetical protein [uncultured Micrococcus sp.]